MKNPYASTELPKTFLESIGDIHPNLRDKAIELINYAQMKETISDNYLQVFIEKALEQQVLFDYKSQILRRESTNIPKRVINYTEVKYSLLTLLGVEGLQFLPHLARILEMSQEELEALQQTGQYINVTLEGFKSIVINSMKKTAYLRDTEVARINEEIDALTLALARHIPSPQRTYYIENNSSDGPKWQTSECLAGKTIKDINSLVRNVAEHTNQQRENGFKISLPDNLPPKLLKEIKDSGCYYEPEQKIIDFEKFKRIVEIFQKELKEKAKKYEGHYLEEKLKVAFISPKSLNIKNKKIIANVISGLSRHLLVVGLSDFFQMENRNNHRLIYGKKNEEKLDTLLHSALTRVKEYYTTDQTINNQPALASTVYDYFGYRVDLSNSTPTKQSEEYRKAVTATNDALEALVAIIRHIELDQSANYNKKKLLLTQATVGKEKAMEALRALVSDEIAFDEDDVIKINQKIQEDRLYLASARVSIMIKEYFELFQSISKARIKNGCLDDVTTIVWDVNYALRGRGPIVFPTASQEKVPAELSEVVASTLVKKGEVATKNGS